MNFVLEQHREVDSTNRVAAERARQGCPAGLVVTAERQTAGRGRRDNSWHSPTGGLWLTAVLRPHRVEGLSLVAGLALGRALTDVSWQLHWPNDLYCGAHKLAGILVESRLMGEAVDFVLVGIGLNVNNRDFPPDLPATSLALEVGREFDLELVRELVLASLGESLELWEREGLAPFLPELRRRCPMVGARVRYRVGSEEHEARVLDVGEDGGLLLEDGECLRSVDRIDLA